jgi:hypothetical protein
MREIRTYGSEGGAVEGSTVPTPIRLSEISWTPAFAGVKAQSGPIRLFYDNPQFPCW